ncbi:TIGR04219 family outer membrane beta-barrel protein, partial [Sulfurovum sp. bin170]|uniref:TIGR04219 family outer membrane beta-barrel protein n=1 Tax=Sulfurovum sp. bin170 TaxID=2695268 RepID=UPI0013DFDD13
SKTFSFGGFQLFNITDNIDTKLDLTMYDLTLYYEILDNWVNVDLGVNLKYIDGTIDIESTTEYEHKSFQAPIPMLYAKARFDVPTTDLSFQAEGNYISYDSNTLYDLEVGARYSFALGFGVEAGYKSFKLKLDDIDDLSMDTDFSGAYGKVVWDF